MRVRYVAAALLASLMTLAACSDDPQEPSALPTLGPSPSPSASAEAEPTPTGINAPTPEGAAEFARHFYAQVREGFRTGSPELVEGLSLPSCGTCANYVRSITTVRDEGLSVDGGDFEIYLAVAPEQAEANAARVDVAWNFSPVVYKDANGAVVEEGPAVRGVEEQLDLVRQGNLWKVSNIKRIRQQS